MSPILALKLAVRGLLPKQPYNPIAVHEDADGCLHIRPRVHAARTLSRVTYWTGNGRASEQLPDTSTAGASRQRNLL